MTLPEGNAIVYCEGAFNTPNGKTAHGLVRRSRRYNVIAVVDTTYSGQDAGSVLDGRKANIPVVANLKTAFAVGEQSNRPPTHFVIGLAPDGGRLPDHGRNAVKSAIALGLNVDSGLHDFISEDPELSALAGKHGVTLRDIRKPPDRKDLHFFSGKIEQVPCLKIALLGSDSAIGKRTTTWLLIDALIEAGYKAEMIGTGQTAWMQGVGYGIILDSLVNDFVAGEIEHAVWSAWDAVRPDVMVLEGQGSLMNPAYPGGFEILAAGRPDFVILQHAPKRVEYDGFPGYPMHPLEKQIKAIEYISDKSVAAITLNHEGMTPDQARNEAKRITLKTGLPCVDVLLDGADELVSAFGHLLPRHKDKP